MHVTGGDLHTTPFFKGIQPEELQQLLRCAQAQEKWYSKGAFVSLYGDIPKHIGIVLRGQLQMIKEDVFGNRTILHILQPGDAFGEAFLCRGHFSTTVSIQAAEDCGLLLLPFDRIMRICPNSCGFHNTLIKNMVLFLAHKNMRLLEKLEVTSKRSLREKALAYLSQLSQEQQSPTVTSRLGRVDLADFLGVDRSALTRELRRMQDDGLITFEKNTYTLLHVGELLY